MHLRDMLKVTSGMNKHSSKNSVKKSSTPLSTVPHKKQRAIVKTRENKYFFPDNFPAATVDPTTTHPLQSDVDEEAAWLLTSQLLDSIDVAKERTEVQERRIEADSSDDDDNLAFDE